LRPPPWRPIWTRLAYMPGEPALPAPEPFRIAAGLPAS
jgi:hypothetical protein